ncbi:unnamed protein product [Rotaria sp. Silwood1]|nr:unnamed protein product [Rotaria sp. Silwood1]CAF1655669.1 unnamed protein product [Rotaria sp. Silwood1]
MFNINSPPEPWTISNLIQILAPYVSVLRKHCTSCTISIPYVSIADISYLLVRSAADKWTTAIDINVYSKNQQFRLFNSVKYGKNNPLIPSITFPFASSLQYSSSDILEKSLITLIEDHQIPKIYFKNKNFIIHFSPYSSSTTTIPQNLLNIKLINDHIEHSCFLNLDTNTNTNQNSSSSLHLNKSNKLDLSIPDIRIFITFVQNIIISDPSHQGYIRSCIRRTYNNNLLFFNIAANEESEQQNLIEEADAECLICLLYLKNIIDKSNNEKTFSIVAEMYDIRNCQLANRTCADDFIVSPNLISKYVSQLSENKNIKKVYDVVLIADDPEIYLCLASMFVPLETPISCYQILEETLKYQCVAIGYRLMKYLHDETRVFGIVLNPDKQEQIIFS